MELELELEGADGIADEADINELEPEEEEELEDLERPAHVRV